MKMNFVLSFIILYVSRLCHAGFYDHYGVEFFKDDTTDKPSENYEKSYAKFMQLWFPSKSSYEDDNEYSSESEKEEYKQLGSDQSNESGSDESDRRYKRSSSYDDAYARFVALHFPHLSNDSEDEKEEYRNVNNDENNDDYEESDGQTSEAESEESSTKKSLSDYDRIKAESEKQALKQDPKNCKTVHKNNSICKVCKDAETGDNSETCSYSSKPKNKKLAFSKQKSFSYKTKPTNKTSDHDEDYDENERADEEEKEVVEKPKRTSKKKYNKRPKSHKSSRIDEEEPEYEAYKLASYYDVDNDEQPKSAKLQMQEKPRKFVTPRARETPLNTDFEFIEPYNFDNADFSRALSDFKYKDWSECDKKIKGEMTCYYCKDHTGLNQEECVYVSGDNNKRNKQPKTNAKLQLPKTFAGFQTPISQPSPFKLPTARLNNNNYYRTALPLFPATSFTTKPESFDNADNSARMKKKAIKRMITIKKHYYENDN